MRVLVVDDERRIADTIKKGLEQERYAVDVAYSGVDGYDLASTEEYDVIVLDRMLPGIEGLEICRRLRKARIHTPVLLLTAKGMVQDKVEGLIDGADDYLAKPFAFEELVARVRALGRRPRRAVSPTLTVADLALDPARFEVKRGNELIQLSGKEFSLLEYLMRHADTIVSKDQIIHHVWDFDADILPNTVEVYIRNLRNKIEKPFGAAKPVIRTVRGFGYKISTA